MNFNKQMLTTLSKSQKRKLSYAVSTVFEQLNPFKQWYCWVCFQCSPLNLLGKMVGTKRLYEILEFGVLNMEFKAHFLVLIYHFSFIDYSLF